MTETITATVEAGAIPANVAEQLGGAYNAEAGTLDVAAVLAQRTPAEPGPRFAERPAWLPEDYFDAAAGDANVEGLARALAEAQEAATAARGEGAPERYTLERDGAKVPLDEEEPLVAGFLEWARKNNLSDGAVGEVLDLFTESINTQLLTDAERAEQFNALYGEEASAAMERVEGFVTRVAGEDEQIKNEMGVLLRRTHGPATVAAILRVAQEGSDMGAGGGSADQIEAMKAEAQEILDDPKAAHDGVKQKRLNTLLLELAKHGETVNSAENVTVMHGSGRRSA